MLRILRTSSRPSLSRLKSQVRRLGGSRERKQNRTMSLHRLDSQVPNLISVSPLPERREMSDVMILDPGICALELLSTSSHQIRPSAKVQNLLLSTQNLGFISLLFSTRLTSISHFQSDPDPSPPFPSHRMCATATNSSPLPSLVQETPRPPTSPHPHIQESPIFLPFLEST
ncbi:hypothetical protein BCR34DRAFT_290014 [Clohesyomyces aquaticus]|uniref:Uncharacterized protein n=1 Tax=Clohesyomyces aquaticus TaxID=1231657 RepID=A0A1Y1ZQW0_9PLEO|nr:hypothetical protein BCR34DRAFT_290014 [Clohesyomyces aquaticus]